MAYADRALPGNPRNPNPALVKHRKKWKNCGHKMVHGLLPGKVGELELTDGEALALIQAGHLVLLVEGKNGRSAEDKEVR